MDKEEFIKKLETMLENTNINFSRKSERRQAFIASIINLAETFCGINQKSSSKMKKKFLAMEGKALSVKPRKNPMMIKRGIVVMTEQESMKRDDQLKGLES